MSDFAFDWLQSNFLNKNLVIYDIGAADLTDSAKFKYFLPDCTVYSFECGKHWHENSLVKSNISLYDLNYVPVAISYTEKTFTFSNQYRNELHPQYNDENTADIVPYAGTLQNTENRRMHTTKNSYQVKGISLNKFCETNPKPDMIHIDIEREEYNALKNLKSKYWPSVIWTEKNEFYCDEEHKDTVPLSMLIQLCADRGMQYQIFDKDILFIDTNLLTTKYIDISKEHWIILDQKFRKDKWIKNYAVCAGSSWPMINEFEDFYKLPENVLIELLNFNALPDKDLLK